MCLRTKFQVSRGGGVILLPPTSKRAPKRSTQIRDHVVPLHSSRGSKLCHSTAVNFGIGTLSYFVVIQFFPFLCNQCVCVCASQLEKPGDSSTRSTRSIETNAISKAYDPYFCKITMTQRERIGLVTVGHIPRELLRFVYLPKVVLLQVLLLVYSIECHLCQKEVGNTNPNDIQSHL